MAAAILQGSKPLAIGRDDHGQPAHSIRRVIRGQPNDAVTLAATCQAPTVGQRRAVTSGKQSCCL
jgi:hypothetical protein